MLKDTENSYQVNPDFRTDQYDLPTSIPIEVIDLNLVSTLEQQ